MGEVTNTRTVLYVTRHEDAAPEDEERARAVDTLRERCRADGMLLDEATVVRGNPVLVWIAADGLSYELDGQGPPNGLMVEWTGEGDPPVDDSTVPVVIIDPLGDATVPEPVMAEGGDLRVLHGFSGEVTVTAFAPDGSGIGYLFAMPVDADTVHMSLVPGTARLRVVRDEG
jgi:hypothetical protein